MNLIILGPQGSGKGTQARLLAQKFNLTHIDIGLALRKEAEKNTALGKKLNEIVNKKKELVTDDIVRKVLEGNIQKADKKRGLIIDGSPRRLKQIDEVQKSLSKFGRKIDKVIFINVSKEKSIERISKRYNCFHCQRYFILGIDIKSAKEKCPQCGKKVKQRKDDTSEGVKKRLAIFQKETMPVIDYFRKRKMLIEVDGEKEIVDTFEELVKNLQHLS